MFVWRLIYIHTYVCQLVCIFQRFVVDAKGLSADFFTIHWVNRLMLPSPQRMQQFRKDKQVTGSEI